MWRLNVLAWRLGEKAYPEFLRALAVGLAFERSVGELVAMAEEIRPETKGGREVKKNLVRSYEFGELYYYSAARANELSAWLETRVDKDWSPLEALSST